MQNPRSRVSANRNPTHAANSPRPGSRARARRPLTIIARQAGRPITVVPPKGSHTSSRGEQGAPSDRPGRAGPRRHGRRSPLAGRDGVTAGPPGRPEGRRAAIIIPHRMRESGGPAARATVPRNQPRISPAGSESASDSAPSPSAPPPPSARRRRAAACRSCRLCIVTGVVADRPCARCCPALLLPGARRCRPRPSGPPARRAPPVVLHRSVSNTSRNCRSCVVWTRD